MSLQCSRKYLQIKKLYCSEKTLMKCHCNVRENIYKYRNCIVPRNFLQILNIEKLCLFCICWSRGHWGQAILLSTSFLIKTMLPQWQLNRQQLLLWALHFGFQRFNNRREVVVTKAKRFCSLVQLVRSCNCRNGLGHWFRQGQCEPHILPWVGVCFIIVKSSAQSWLGPTRCKWNCSSMLN